MSARFVAGCAASASRSTAATSIKDVTMKSITLTGPSARNSQEYVDAGVTLDVGDKPQEIALDRADVLVATGRAEVNDTKPVPAAAK
jgi:hypothetical protein